MKYWKLIMNFVTNTKNCLPTRFSLIDLILNKYWNISDSSILVTLSVKRINFKRTLFNENFLMSLDNLKQTNLTNINKFKFQKNNKNNGTDKDKSKPTGRHAKLSKVI